MANPYLVQALYGQKTHASAAPRTPPSSVTMSSSPAIANSFATSPSSRNILTSNPTEAHLNDGAPLLSLPDYKSVSTITPVTHLKYKQERYLPPAGPYYDQHNLSTLFPSGYFLENGTYFKPFKAVQEGTARFSQKACEICRTTDHPRKHCPMIYCSYSWWSERGLSSVPIHVQVRPTLAEAARLAGPVGFGIIKAFEENGDFVVPRPTHPVTRMFYGDGPPPHPLKEIVSLETKPRWSSGDKTPLPRANLLSPATTTRFGRKSVTFEVKADANRNDGVRLKGPTILSTQSVQSFQPFSLKPALKSVQDIVDTSLEPCRRHRAVPSNTTIESSLIASTSSSDIQAYRHPPYQRNHLALKNRDSVQNIDNPPVVSPPMPQEQIQTTLHSSRNGDRSHNFHKSGRLYRKIPPRTTQARDYFQSKSESRIQELENRVLVLEKIIVTKDKEICRLKGESKEQRRTQEGSDVGQTGSKRTRYDRDGMDKVFDRIGGVLKDLK